jgi:hypothetical protein
MLSQAMVQSEKLIVSTGRQAAFITRLPTNQSVDPEKIRGSFEASEPSTFGSLESFLFFKKGLDTSGLQLI